MQKCKSFLNTWKQGVQLGTKEEMQRLLADAQKLTGVKYDINNLSDVYQAIHAIQGKLSITGTTAKEASTTIVGSFNAMKASFTNVLGALATGFGLQEALNGLAQTTSTFLFKNLIPMIGRIIIALPGSLYTFIAAAIPQFAQMGSEMISGLVGGMGNFSTVLQEFFTTLLPEFLINGIQVVEQIMLGIQTGLPNLINAIGTVWTTGLSTIGTYLPTAIRQISGFFVQLVDTILTKLPGLITSWGTTVSSNLGNILTEICNLISGILPQILDLGFEMIVKLSEGIVQNIPTIAQAILDVLAKLLDTIIQHLPQMLQKGVELIGKLADGIIHNMPTVVSNLVSGLKQLVQVIVSNFPTFLQKGLELIAKLGIGIVQSIPSLVSSAAKVIKSVVTEIVKFIPEFVKIGGELLFGLAKGIAGAVGSVISGAIDACKGVVNSVKSFFGIHSPSRVFSEIGMYLDYGLAQGISDNLSPVEKAMQEVKSLVNDDFKESVEYSLSTSAGTISTDLQSTDDKRTLDLILSTLENQNTELYRMLLRVFEELKFTVDDREFARLVREVE